MHSFYKPVEMFGEDVKVSKSESDYTTYKYVDCGGLGIMKTYHVFPGIQLVFNDFKMKSCFRKVKTHDEIISINYCLKGRYECRFNNDLFGYIGQGDMAVNSLENNVIASAFPTNEYMGITVLFHKVLVKENMKSEFEKYSIDFRKVLNKISNNKFIIMRANKHALHIFEELYSAYNINSLRNGYFKLKVLELMLFLCIDEDIIVDERRKTYPKEQIEIIKHIKRHLEESPSKHITIEELAREHGIAKTTLKTCFKDIYGISPYAYIKDYRMKMGAKMLQEREKNVTEIAMILGYQNASKFSRAFKDVFKYSPKEYQNMKNGF